MTEGLKRSLGTKLRAARDRAGITQEKLAARTKLSPESISNIERGHQLPTLETLYQLGRILGVPLGELLEGIGERSNASAERMRLEARLREVARGLNDRDLTVALGQIELLAGRIRR